MHAREGKKASKAAERAERADDLQTGLETITGDERTRVACSAEHLGRAGRPIPRRSQQLDVLVEWEGVDDFSQQPYVPSWVSVKRSVSQSCAQS